MYWCNQGNFLTDNIRPLKFEKYIVLIKIGGVEYIHNMCSTMYYTVQSPDVFQTLKIVGCRIHEFTSVLLRCFQADQLTNVVSDLII